MSAETSVEPDVATLAALIARRERTRASIWAAGLAAFVACALGASILTEFSPARLIAGLPRAADFFAQAAPHLDPAHLFANKHTEGSIAYWYYAWDKWLGLVWQSIEMAILATAASTALAFPLAFLAARATTPHPAISILTKRFFELFRTIPDIVLALIFVFAFGIGPLAGVLAIAIHSTGALGKLFAEAIENIDARPGDGVRAAGGGFLDVIRYAAMPQVLPNVASYALLRFEINVAAAAAIGFVGAGGIGQEFTAAIAFSQFQDAAAIMLMTIVVIAAIDLTSEAIRHRLIRAPA